MKFVIDSATGFKWAVPEINTDNKRAFAISSQHRIGIYDCLYVALAEREGCDLITPDDRLVKVLQSHCPFVIPLSSLP